MSASFNRTSPFRWTFVNKGGASPETKFQAATYEWAKNSLIDHAHQFNVLQSDSVRFALQSWLKILSGEGDGLKANKDYTQSVQLVVFRQIDAHVLRLKPILQMDDLGSFLFAHRAFPHPFYLSNF
jgi:hypothetical protein